MLTDGQRERYARHIMLREMGVEGQKRLLAGRVLVIGAGGLGSPAAFYLAAAGVGTIGVADGDRVELSNLQRQILHRTADLGMMKVDSAKETLTGLNPDVQVITHPFRVTTGEIDSLIDGYDFVIDATDNFDAKFLINDACVRGGKPFSHGGILRFDGQTMTVRPGETPCYRCLFPDPPPPDIAPLCSRDGVLGVVPGVIGTIQAAEAIKYLLGIGDLLTGRLLTMNILTLRFREVTFGRNPHCPLCGETGRGTMAADVA